MTGILNSDSPRRTDAALPSPAAGAGRRMRVADLRDRIRLDLERRGVHARPGELDRVIGCACGYQGFALRRRGLSWHCPKCAQKTDGALACYDLPVAWAETYAAERLRLSRSRRWTQSVIALVATTSLAAILALALIWNAALRPGRILLLKRDLQAKTSWLDVVALVQANGQRNPDFAKRLEAVKGLASNGQTGLNVLVEALPDQPGNMREAIIEALHNAGPAGEMALAGGLRKSPQTARLAAAALGVFGPSALFDLQKALSHDDEQVRLAAVRTVGRLKAPPDQIASALAPAARDPSEAVRSEAARILGELGLKAPPVSAP